MFGKLPERIGAMQDNSWRFSENGAVELRKRRQMAVGDVVQIEGGPGLTLTIG